MKGYIVYATYSTINEKTIIKLFGRLENGQSFVTLNQINPYFFVKTHDVSKIKKYLEKYKVEKTKLSNFAGFPVSKILAPTRPEINKLHKILEKSINTYEADINPHMRFMIDNNLQGTIEIQGNWNPSEKVDRVYHEPKVTPSEFKPNLKIASIDIESDKYTGKLFCIGLYSENYEKCFMVTDKKLKKTISCKDESECLRKFREELFKLDPDIITGWSLVDFDLKHLQKLFEKNKLPFDLGRTNDRVRLRIESNFFRASSAIIPGRQVLDGLDLIKDPFIKEAPSIKHAKFDSLALEDVAQEILGTGKLIKGKNRHQEITNLYKKDPQKIVDYNLLDCKLVYDILEKTKTINLAIERTQLTGLTLDRLFASIAAFDSLYIREARKKSLVSPTTRFGNKEKRIRGGFVQSPEPGIYHNVIVLDFKSLYPSIIRTFNIDPASYLEHKQKEAIESPNKAYFTNSEGVLPKIIKKLHEAREKAKKEKRELSNYSLKIIQNSFFGVLASPNCRYFNLDIANAITHFGQMLIRLTAKEVEKMGYKTIYSDTDSIFVETNLGKGKANDLGRKIEKKINEFYKKYTKKRYNRESQLELEFEKQYLSLMMPKHRGETTAAAKKRYAGLVEKKGKEELEIVGLEAIRGDWTEAARDFQKQLLLKAFKKQPVAKFIREYVKKIKSRNLDEKLVYSKSIRKSLEKYTKTTPPHVKAARKLDHLDSNIIKYYITIEGPEPIQKLKHKINYEHYIKKQIEPIANQILSLIGKDFESIVKKSKQETLF